VGAQVSPEQVRTATTPERQSPVCKALEKYQELRQQKTDAHGKRKDDTATIDKR